MKQRKTKYLRFSSGQRVEHALLIISFTILTITGLPQRYATTSLGDSLIQIMGGIEFVRVVHRVAATVLMLETIYHGVVVAYKVIVLRVSLTMLPGFKDAKDAFQTFVYNLGFLKTPPQMGRYTFAEKAEYWAVVWGTVIMIITGFMLWNPIATANLLPGQFVLAAKAAHSGEALLAALAIVTWHVYNVHIKYFNRSIFTGYISTHEMEEEHALELAQIEANQTQAAISATVLASRRRLFIPITAIITVILLVGVYYFVTFEQTAITTIPLHETEMVEPSNTN